ncbi:MAG: SpoIID/LytB domain-containing protein [Patescibacteria group bacterium]
MIVNKQILKFTFLFIFLSYSLIVLPSLIYAQTCDPSCSNAVECKDKIAKCQEAWNQMETAKLPHVTALRKMEAEIAAFQARIKTIEADLVHKAQAISQGEKELTGYLTVAARRIHQFYIRSFITNPLATFLSTTNIGSLLRVMTYNRAVTNEDKRTITQTALSVKDLEDKKKVLENEKSSLAYLKEETDRRAASVRKLVGEAEAYQSKLTGIIASLTAQQQAILNARSGTFTTSVGDVPLADDPNAAPTFNPGFSPAFAGFSFGAYTHKKGMSQYGAKGRAESGQSYQDILRAYYGKTAINKDTSGTISVAGFGNLDFENYYLLGIAEMPSSFPKEALKAQAVAARTFALRYKNLGQVICATQACQVFSKAKADSPPGGWRAAVEETRGQVLEDTVGYYSSTTGGYITTMGWDTTCGNQGCWTGGAYEKIAASPWFYKGWYTVDYYNSSAKCGRSHPWLNGEEFADILNAWVVLTGGGDKGRILPVTINSCPINGTSGNPYSMSELRDLGGFTSVTSVSVTYNSGGYTESVILQTNKGLITISGSDFKQAFNLRAPGYISIRSSLYNVEKK